MILSLSLPPSASALRVRNIGMGEPTPVTGAIEARLAGMEEGWEERWDLLPDVQGSLEDLGPRPRRDTKRVLRVAQILAHEMRFTKEERRVLRFAVVFDSQGEWAASQKLSQLLPPAEFRMAEEVLSIRRQWGVPSANRIAQVLNAAELITEGMRKYYLPFTALVLEMEQEVKEGKLPREIFVTVLSLLYENPSNELREHLFHRQFMGILQEIHNASFRKQDRDLLESIPARYSDGKWHVETAQFARSVQQAEKEQVRVHIRWMIRRDLRKVQYIEQNSSDYPWTEEDFLRCLRQRNCIGMVAEQGERVVGFMIYELHKNKLHILNFAVHPQWRRSGIGAQMVAKLVSKLSSHRRTRITLELRETNLPAQLFFRKLEFRAVRVLRKYYDDTGEDAFLMQYTFEGEMMDLDLLRMQGLPDFSEDEDPPSGLEEALGTAHSFLLLGGQA